jgi:hypothetical protein
MPHFFLTHPLLSLSIKCRVWYVVTQRQLRFWRVTGGKGTALQCAESLAHGAKCKNAVLPFALCYMLNALF